jgi:hypothetical protein
VGVDFDVAGVDHQPFKIGIDDQLFQQSLPEALVAPAAKATVGVFPVPVIGRQIPPGSAGAQNPKNGVEKKPVVFGSATPESLLTGQMGFEELPGFVVDVVAAVSMWRYGGSLGEVRRFSAFFSSLSIS